MILFFHMYLVGLLIGLVIYALTYLFGRETKNKKRVFVVAFIGILSLIGSISLIGGFTGMPFGVLSLGILTISFLLAFFGHSLLWKKTVYTFVILFVVMYSAFVYLNQVDYWIVKKTHYSYDDELSLYLQQLQDDTSIQGYKTFTISEGNKGIVLSLGGDMAGNNIEVLDVEEQGKTTIIKIRTFYNQSKEKNPVIAIGINRLHPEIVISDTNGKTYEQVNSVK